MLLGADKKIRNSEKKEPYDLAKNPEAASFLKDRAGKYEAFLCFVSDNVRI